MFVQGYHIISGILVAFVVSCIVISSVLVELGLLRVGDTVNTRLPNHDIEHDFMFSTVQDKLCMLLKAESLIDSDIFASAALNIAGFIQRISLHTDG